MNVLVVGSGGREHALAWKIAQSPVLTTLYATPGNPGTASVGENLPTLEAAKAKSLDLVVVGPEAPLADGLADQLEAEGIAVFGPSREAAQLEASKIFAKQCMAKAGVPTAPFEIFDDYDVAAAHIDKVGGPIVIKADGLAAGKGVIVAATKDDALDGLRKIMKDRAFGAAGARVLIEECLVGREVSLIALTDGTRAIPLAAARDHKRAHDGDKGPNTGGMGAFSPPADVTPALTERIMAEVIHPTVAAMSEAGTPVRGALYAGIMMVGDDPFVLEFNVRFGDPETQPLLARMKSDLLPLLAGCAHGELPANEPLEWDERPACCVVMASGGYPGSYEKGKKISGIDAASALEHVTVFQAGTRMDEDGDLVTSGGRVLGVTALGSDLASASARAYEAVDKIQWDGVQFRTDIGRR